MFSNSAELEILDDLRSGSSHSFERLYHNYFRMVEDLVIKMGGSHEDARDIFQEVLFVLMKKIKDPEFILKGKLSTYLFAVARNLYLKGAAKKHREKVLDESAYRQDEISLIDENLDADSQSVIDLVKLKLKELEKDCQSIIVYSFYLNLSQQKIAELMDYSPAFVKVKKFRCLEYLRKKVKGSVLLNKIME